MNYESAMSNEQLATVNKQPIVLRFFAHLLSYIFHPIFVPIYLAYFLEFIHPSYFAGYSVLGKYKLLLLLALNAVAFPLITVLLMRGLGFIKSINVRDQRERILLYISSMIFFFWTYYVLREQEDIPRILVSLMFGVFISSAAALIANIYFKVSMHAIGMGGMVGLFIVILFQNTMLMAVPLSVGLLLAGLVCTSRLIVSDHTPKEIYTGLIIGLLCQFAGVIVILS